MSLEALTAVFTTSAARGAARLVLLVIADHHNTTTCHARPGLARIAARAGCDERTARRAIRALEDAGELIVEQRPGTASLYAIDLPGLTLPPGVAPPGRNTPGETPPGNPSTTPGDAPPTPGIYALNPGRRTPRTHEPIEPSEPSAAPCPSCGEPADEVPIGIMCDHCDRLYPHDWKGPTP